MSKKHFIALAEAIRMSNAKFTHEQLTVLADFCKSQNGNFLRERWLGYIAGTNGPSGGTIKAKRWDRSRCMEQVCTCHDETAEPYSCSSCGCGGAK